MLEPAFAYLAANAQWATLVAVVLVGIVSFGLIRNLVSRGPQIPTPQKMDDAGFIKWLASYRDWYTHAAGMCNKWLVFCRITPILVGFMVAIVSALD